jgi:hypothetical protein
MSLSCETVYVDLPARPAGPAGGGSQTYGDGRPWVSVEIPGAGLYREGVPS